MKSLCKSMEAISFQIGKDFPKKLDHLFEQVMIYSGDVRKLDDILSEVRSLTFETTGINMEIKVVKKEFFRPFTLSVETPNYNTLSPLNAGAVKRLRDMNLDTFKVQSVLDGEVDLKEGRVSGFFSKILFKMTISENLLNDVLDPDELTAIYLHELGHPFTILEYMGQSLITNVVLAEVLGQLDPEDTAIRRYEVGTYAAKLCGSKDNIPEDPKIEEISAIVLKGQMTRMQNRINSRWYDERLAEAVADQFAARWMKGASLVKAIGKIQRQSGLWAENGYEPIWIGLTMNFINIITIPYNTATRALVKVGMRRIIESVATGFLVSLAMNALSFTANSVKDAPKDRIEAIRREIITLLKDKNLPDDVRKTALEDLRVIDKEKGSIHSFSDVYSQLTNFVMQSLSGRREELNRHKLQENLANNRLYELSAILKG